MNCGVCYKPMRKDIKIDGVPTCYTCKMIWIKAYKKVYDYAIENKEELKY
jgi:hypothetical protein